MKTIDKQSPFLKAHLRDGGVALFSRWSVDTSARTVIGQAQVYDAYRSSASTRLSPLPVDSVVLFETNVVSNASGVVDLSMMSAVSALTSVICLTNPKACFGSCPTFYVEGGNGELLQAEGFSASILPSLEATDIDALCRAVPQDGDFRVTMKNEAYETHVVRSVNLLVAPRTADERVFVTPSGSYWKATKMFGPDRASGPEGDCKQIVQSFDGSERFSVTDSNDLASREQLELHFSDVPKGKTGLVLAMRQTLLSTYLFYQTLSYLGKSAGEYLARFERGDFQLGGQIQNLSGILGGIKIFMKQSDSLRFVEEVSETGPLAIDTHLLLLPDDHPADLTLVLEMTRGAWRIDWAALAGLDSEVFPQRIFPSRVLHNGTVDENGRVNLLKSSRGVTTLPGDEYEFLYQLPAAGQYEYFLESRGYYLEWMREEWYKEEDLTRAATLFLSPQEALRTMAPEFKKVESTMETMFWSSKYVRR
ncbi:MAG TPA: hypothetical protein VL633_10380 [Bacteroidota bacterium]|nr:hypothetical protein [Bacteroidota bacterium]